MTLDTSTLAIIHDAHLTYPAFPYSPPQAYPELAASDRNADNKTYDAVRSLLKDLGLDSANFSKKTWNPFKGFIKPGQTVLLKPNWVRDFNSLNPDSIDDLVTHTAILRPLIDYVLIALEGKGTLIVADAPLQDCDFDALQEKTRASELVEWFKSRTKSVEFQVLDLRKTIRKRQTAAEALAGKSFQFEQEGDARGYSLVDLGQASFLTDIQQHYKKFRVTNYDYRLLQEHHTTEKHEYLVANAILAADVIINVPKMKCHIKAGLTGALKNLIGINGNKEYLPHHIVGSAAEGGDQYIYKSRIKEWHNKIYDEYWAHHKEQSYSRNKWQTTLLLGLAALSKIFDKENLYDGGWSGNDTIPRTTLDLNHILAFYNLKTGKMDDKPTRKVLHIIDGIVAGEGHGPLQPTAKHVGVLIGSFNPLLADIAMAQLMGYDPQKVKTLAYGLSHKKSRLSAGVTSLEKLDATYNGKKVLVAKLPNLHFELPKFWRDAARHETA